MNGSQGLLLVAGREVRERGRSKGFLVSMVLTIVFIAAVIILPQLLGGGPSTHRVGLVGEGNESVMAAVEELAIANLEPGEEPDTFETIPFPDRQAANTALENDQVDVLLIDGSELVTGSGGFFGGSGLVELFQQAAGTVRIQELLAENPDAAEDVIEILSSEPLAVTTLGGEDPDGDTRPLVAYAGLVLMYIAILSYGTWTLTGVTEEKSSRVVEVLLGTLKPWQLLGGKVLGIGLLGVSQFLLTLLVALLALRLTDSFELPAISVESLSVLLLWFILGFAVYSVAFGAAGSLASRPEEAQSASFPLSMVAVVGFFVSFQVLNEPQSLAARIATFFPFTAPYVVPIRNALDSISPVEHVLSIIVMMTSIVVIVRLSGRVYRGGVLGSGARIKIREAWRGGAS